jgi:hypothetical protein
MSYSDVVAVMDWRPLALEAGKASRSFVSEFEIHIVSGNRRALSGTHKALIT